MSVCVLLTAALLYRNESYAASRSNWLVSNSVVSVCRRFVVDCCTLESWTCWRSVCGIYSKPYIRRTHSSRQRLTTIGEHLLMTSSSSVVSNYTEQRRTVCILTAVLLGRVASRSVVGRRLPPSNSTQVAPAGTTAVQMRAGETVHLIPNTVFVCLIFP